jgi:multidrug transporter EmrE-like cation transporter
MAFEAILGSIVGGGLRMVPEILSFFDKKNERKHEIALGDQQYRVAELQFRTQREVKDLDVEQSQFVTAMQALTEGVKAQAASTGIKWVDAISALVRPSITAWVFTLYSIVKLSALTLAMQTEKLSVAVYGLWDANDQAMLSAIVMFWFVGRIWKLRSPNTP